MSRPYRKLSLYKEQYLIDNYDDEPKVIAQIAAHLQVKPQQVLKYAKYRNLRASSRCNWGEEELQLLDGFAETMPLRMLVSTWNRLAQKEGRQGAVFTPSKRSCLSGDIRARLMADICQFQQWQSYSIVPPVGFRL